MWALKIFIILLVIMLLIGFSIYNSGEYVSVNLFGWQYSNVPMIIITYWSLVIGMFISFILGVSYYLVIQKEMREQRKENKRLMDEITALRNLPLEEERPEQQINE
ncbi:MAG: LapA family protein [candidate division Zixibacteria bacterium]|nr:LapA family protein [candidate division Zixibacteria bacterium]